MWCGCISVASTGVSFLPVTPRLKTPDRAIPAGLQPAASLDTGLSPWPPARRKVPFAAGFSRASRSSGFIQSLPPKSSHTQKHRDGVTPHSKALPWHGHPAHACSRARRPCRAPKPHRYSGARFERSGWAHCSRFPPRLTLISHVACRREEVTGLQGRHEAERDRKVRNLSP